MAVVELVYDADCPNVKAARAQLLRAFVQAGVTARWTEHLTEDAPPYARGLGSPSILVNGRDVAGAAPDGQSCCRLYESERGALAGVPDVSTIAEALAQARPPPPHRAGVASGLSVLPAIGAALLPKVACPACWPAYAGALGALGLTFLLDVRWLLPLTAVFLAIAVGILALRARRGGAYGPLGLAVAASAAVLVGKFVADSDVAMYAGVALLVGASLWSSWPARRRACTACPAEEPTSP